MALIRRGPIFVVGNTSDTPEGNPQGGAVLVTDVDGVYVQNNVQPLTPNRTPPMYLVVAVGCTGIAVQGNTIVGGSGQVISS